jgi:hypothetical protein
LADIVLGRWVAGRYFRDAQHIAACWANYPIVSVVILIV